MDKLNAIPTSPSARNGRGEKVLVINPGSTSTKIGVFEDENLIFEETLRHSTEEIAQYASIIDQ